MNILCDFHHADLWWAMQLLAERLGATLYRPYGMEWFDQGYFKLYGDLRRKDPYHWIAKQYLVDTIFPITNNSSMRRKGIGRETYNGCEDYPLFNLLTLEEAKNIKIDIVICSVHDNEPYFAKLKEFYPDAKFVRQVGNDLDTIIDEELYPNLLSSAVQPFNAFGGHKMLYKQEFDLNLFKYEEPKEFKNIYSFQGDIENFDDMWIFWTELKHKLIDYRFQSFGVGCEQGKIYPKREYIKKMNEATFIPQSKGPWEGYGHVVFNSFCLGRPMIIKQSDYQGKIAEPLLIKDETFLDMDDPDIVEKIRYYSDPRRFKKMSLRCRQAFEENVNFDQDGVQLKEFFENLR